MHFKTILAAIAGLLLLNACANKETEAAITAVQETAELVQEGKAGLSPFTESAQKLGKKIELVPTDVQEKPEFAAFYEFAYALSTKYTAVETAYTDLENKLKQMEDDLRTGKRKKEEVEPEIQLIEAQVTAMTDKIPLMVQVADSLSNVYDQLTAGATGTPQPVQISDAARGGSALNAVQQGAVAPQDAQQTAPSPTSPTQPQSSTPDNSSTRPSGSTQPSLVTPKKQQ